MQARKILFITDAHTPPLYGRRTRFFCKKFHTDGYKVRLLCEKYEEPIPFTEPYELIEIPYYCCNNGIASKAEWVIKNILSILFDYRNRYFSRKIRQIETNEQPDIIVCSTFSTMGLRAAANLAKREQIPFIIDLRDIVEQASTESYERCKGTNAIKRATINIFRHISVRRRNTILRRADTVTAVAPWTTSFLKQFNPNTHLIYNGYEDELNGFVEESCQKFKIVYTGVWYGAVMQNPIPLFLALQNIKAAYPDIYANIEIDWYTRENSIAELDSLANKYSIADINHYHPLVPFSDIPSILHQSSAILVLTDPSAHHVLPTKLFEAIGVEKPTICVSCTSGTIFDIITETNAGIATSNCADVENFILEKHSEWKANGFTHQLINNSHRYSRNYQYTILKSLVDKLIENNKK